MSDRPTPLEFLEAVYCDEDLPLSVRMRAAVECAPYVHPKLTAVVTTSMNGQDFARMLERAIERSQAPLKQIELRPDETAPGVSWTGPLRAKERDDGW
jgi:hypothetical protein